MKISWQTESDRLVSRWSVEADRIRYNPPWMQDASQNIPTSKNPSPSDSVTANVSPFGGGGWYALDRLK